MDAKILSKTFDLSSEFIKFAVEKVDARTRVVPDLHKRFSSSWIEYSILNLNCLSLNTI